MPIEATRRSAFLGELVGGLGGRVARRLERLAEREVHDVHAVLERGLQRVHDDPALVEPSQPKTLYAPKVTSGATPVTAVGADDAGHVGAVAAAVGGVVVGFGFGEFGVVRVEVVADEVGAEGDAAVGAEAAAEVGVGVVDAGVDDADLDAFAGDAAGMGVGGAGRLDGLGQFGWRRGGFTGLVQLVGDAGGPGGDDVDQACSTMSSRSRRRAVAGSASTESP